jgi:hypothetical protein
MKAPSLDSKVNRGALDDEAAEANKGALDSEANRDFFV